MMATAQNRKARELWKCRGCGTIEIKSVVISFARWLVRKPGEEVPRQEPERRFRREALTRSSASPRRFACASSATRIRERIGNKFLKGVPFQFPVLRIQLVLCFPARRRCRRRGAFPCCLCTELPPPRRQVPAAGSRRYRRSALQRWPSARFPRSRRRHREFPRRSCRSEYRSLSATCRSRQERAARLRRRTTCPPPTTDRSCCRYCRTPRRTGKGGRSPGCRRSTASLRLNSSVRPDRPSHRPCG